MAETKAETKMHVTVEQLEQALQEYEMLLPAEITEVFRTMLCVPPFAMKVTPALQQAVSIAKSPLTPHEVFHASGLPAFLMGLLVGIGQREKPRIIA